MKHNLKISVSREPKAGGLVSCRTITLREKLLSRLLGNKQKVMVLIPGNSVFCAGLPLVAKSCRNC